MDLSESDACALAGLRVIIVEDEAMLALCLGEIIEGEGCLVIGTAATLGEALFLAETATFDLAIIDLHLHGQQTNEVAASIIRSGHAIIISTGSDAFEVPAEFHEWPVLRNPSPTRLYAQPSSPRPQFIRVRSSAAILCRNARLRFRICRRPAIAGGRLTRFIHDGSRSGLARLTG